MNNKKQIKQPVFAEVNLTGDEFEICQLHADLHYFLCMEPVDMRKQLRGLQGLISEYYNFKKYSYLCKVIKR